MISILKEIQTIEKCDAKSSGNPTCCNETATTEGSAGAALANSQRTAPAAWSNAEIVSESIETFSENN